MTVVVLHWEQLRAVRAPSTPCPSLAEKSHEDPLTILNNLGISDGVFKVKKINIMPAAWITSVVFMRRAFFFI